MYTVFNINCVSIELGLFIGLVGGGGIHKRSHGLTGLRIQQV